MKNTKIYQVLERLNVYELNRFTKFVNSPYFNVNESLVSLNKLIQGIIRNDKEEVTKLKVWSEIFSSTIYNDTKFRKLCTDLLKLAERFLAQEIFDENPMNQAAYLIEAISKYKIERLEKSAWSSAQRLVKRQLERSSSYYYYQYQLEKNYYYLADFEVNRSKEINVELIADFLDKFYIAEKLRYLNLANSQKNVVQREFKMRFIDEITSLIQSGEFTDIPEIAIYNQILLVQNNPEDEGNYARLRDLIKEHIHLFPQIEARDIYFVAVNYCIKMNNKGIQKYLRELFINYQELLKLDLVFIQGELSPWTFKNIVTAGVRLNEYDWVERFIKKYQGHLNLKLRQNAVTFNLARLNYYKQDFDKVISLLQEVEFSDMSYNLSSKALLIACYYELDEFDVLETFLNTFRTFLNRNKKKITVQRRNNYLNLIKYVKKLISLFPNDKDAIKALIEEVKTGTNIADKRWLLKKLEELL